MFLVHVFVRADSAWFVSPVSGFLASRTELIEESFAGISLTARIN